MIRQILASEEVWGALIGVGSLGAAWIGAKGWDYFKWKITGNGRCNGGKHCADHDKVISTLTKLEENYEDEKQVGLYVEAIKRANSNSRVLGTDIRD